MNLTNDNEHADISATTNNNFATPTTYGIPSAPILTTDNNHTITKHLINNNPSFIPTTELNKYYTASQVPIFNKPPLSNLDPRVKDSIELCSFAVAAMKKNELSIAKERLKEALQRLELIS